MIVAATFNVAELDLVGNRCGHLPGEPRFYTIPEQYKLPPSVIQYAINNLQNFYTAPHRWLKKLSLTRDSTRQERSEAREADCAVAGIILQYLDLVSLRFGMTQGDGSFRSFNIRFIAKKLGWRNEEDEAKDREALKRGDTPKHKGLKRVQRSLERLGKAGYISTYTRCKIARGEGGETKHIGLAAIRCLSATFFYDLGIRPEDLKKKRDEALKRLKKRVKKEVEAKRAAERRDYDEVLKKIKLKQKKRDGFNPPKPISELLENQGCIPTIARQSIDLIRTMLKSKCSTEKQPDG